MASTRYDSTILVTGGTTGLGYECALVIARQQPSSKIIIAARSSGDAAAAAINRETGQSNVQYKRLDLSDLAGVRNFACDTTIGSGPPIIALVLNAGLQIVSGVTYTKDNIETTFGVNHVGHALLFHLLMPNLAPNARIVIVSSGTHDPKQKTGLPDAAYQTAELLAHPIEEPKMNSGPQRYATSKLCNVLWLYALERRRAAKPESRSWTVNAFDPGMMPGTGLARDYGVAGRFLWNHVLPRLKSLLRIVVMHNIHTPQESGQSLAKLAMRSDISGKYFEGDTPIKSSEDSYNEDKQDDLWQWTIEFVSGDEREASKFASPI